MKQSFGSLFVVYFAPVPESDLCMWVHFPVQAVS